MEAEACNWVGKQGWCESRSERGMRDSNLLTKDVSVLAEAMGEGLLESF